MKRALLFVIPFFFTIALANPSGGGGGTPTDLKPYPTTGTIYYKPPKTGSGSTLNSRD
jgi:hypothetical protein